MSKNIGIHVTIKDVAKRAGVSPSTASRVINRTVPVSEDKVKRVLNAAEELGYIPNATARSLRSRLSKVIGVILTDITNPFYPAVVKGIDDGARKNGYSITLYNTNYDPDQEERFLLLMIQNRVAGIIDITSRIEDRRVFDKIGNTPIVFVDKPEMEFHRFAVMLDNVKGGFEATSYLIRLGHRRIAVISSPLKESLVVNDRFKGYLKALQQAGIEYDPRLVIDTIPDGVYGDSDLEVILKLMQIESPPSAIFAFHDRLAIHAGQLLKRYGLRIPEDISLVGYDDIEGARFFDPPLTTVRQDQFSMGEKAVDLLLKQMSDPGRPEKILLEPKLIIRQSCRRIE
ncbi:MAG: LacI family DNA-binding transcriptional regulator [bacterium]